MKTFKVSLFLICLLTTSLGFAKTPSNGCKATIIEASNLGYPFCGDFYEDEKTAQKSLTTAKKNVYLNCFSLSNEKFILLATKTNIISFEESCLSVFNTNWDARCNTSEKRTVIKFQTCGTIVNSKTLTTQRLGE